MYTFHVRNHSCDVSWSNCDGTEMQDLQLENEQFQSIKTKKDVAQKPLVWTGGNCLGSGFSGGERDVSDTKWTMTTVYSPSGRVQLRWF